MENIFKKLSWKQYHTQCARQHQRHVEMEHREAGDWLCLAVPTLLSTKARAEWHPWAQSLRACFPRRTFTLETATWSSKQQPQSQQRAQQTMSTNPELESISSLLVI